MNKSMIIFLLIVTIVIVDYRHRYERKPITALKALTMPVIKFQTTYTAWATIYHPTAAECGWDSNLTASGRTGAIGMCAVSQTMLDYVNFNDTIEVLSGFLKGKYVVTDKAGSKARLIDIWRPVGDTIADCYKTKFRVIKSNN